MDKRIFCFFRPVFLEKLVPSFSPAPPKKQLLVSPFQYPNEKRCIIYEQSFEFITSSNKKCKRKDHEWIMIVSSHN